MKIFAFRIEEFDDNKEDYTNYVRGWVCAESYGAAAEKLYEDWKDVIVSMSLCEMEYEDVLLLEDVDVKDFPFKEDVK